VPVNVADVRRARGGMYILYGSGLPVCVKHTCTNRECQSWTILSLHDVCFRCNCYDPKVSNFGTMKIDEATDTQPR
jgi:hypothetical protein